MAAASLCTTSVGIRTFGARAIGSNSSHSVHDMTAKRFGQPGTVAVEVDRHGHRRAGVIRIRGGDVLDHPRLGVAIAGLLAGAEPVAYALLAPVDLPHEPGVVQPWSDKRKGAHALVLHRGAHGIAGTRADRESPDPLTVDRRVIAQERDGVAN